MTVAVIHCARVLLKEGWAENIRLILDKRGDIARVESAPPAEGDYRLTGVVLPGMPNAHSHGFQRAIAGLTGQQAAAGDSFWSWREAMYQVAQQVSPDQMQNLVAGLYAEMLKAGYTSCAEFHYLHHAVGGQFYDNRAEMSLRVLAGAELAGMPLTLLPVLYGRAGFNASHADSHQQRFINRIDDYALMIEEVRKAINESPLARFGLAPHSLRAVSENDLGLLLTLRRSGEPVHIHVAEQPAEVEDCLRNHGQRPLEFLQTRFEPDENWCLVHATHISDSELVNAARSGAVAGICPTTEADLGDGIFKARQWFDHKGAIAIGSDSNLRICVTGELRLLEYSQRLAFGKRNVLNLAGNGCARSLYEKAARGGGQALAQNVGALAPGYRADLLELDLDHPFLAGLHDDDLLDSFVFAGDSGMLNSVWVAGQKMVEQGIHRAEEELCGRYATALRELRT